MIWALGILASVLLGGVGFLWHKALLADALKEGDLKAAQAKDAVRQFQEEQGKVARLESERTFLKGELAKMEVDLAKCDSPAAVLGRLRELLSSPGGHADSPVGVLVPPKATAGA